MSRTPSILRTGLSDTTPEAQAVLDEVYRQMPVGRKWQLLQQAQRTGRLLAEGGYRLQYPHATEREFQNHWTLLRTGRPLSHPQGEAPLLQPGEDVRVVREVVTALDRLGIPYALGGSMASSIYGVLRYTNDADLTVEPFAGREQALADCFGPEHYVSVAAMQEANRQRRSFNLIDTTIGFKVDLFVRKDRPFEISAMSRRVAMSLSDRPEQPLFVLSAEDVILFKLEWYRLGEEASERQWLDVLNVLKAQAERLDRGYLTQWAVELGVDDLLNRALDDAGMQR